MPIISKEDEIRQNKRTETLIRSNEETAKKIIQSTEESKQQINKICSEVKNEILKTLEESKKSRLKKARLFVKITAVCFLTSIVVFCFSEPLGIFSALISSTIPSAVNLVDD